MTFVDNHDTQPGQALSSFIPAWFKPLAYALILLRKGRAALRLLRGITTAFPMTASGRCPGLRTLLRLRKKWAYGEQRDYTG